jgi:hypothetical protein
MNALAKLTAQFDPNWTTILVGWNGLGVLSPWPADWSKFPPLLSTDELIAYANVRLACASDPSEDDLIVRLLALDLHTESRETIRELLLPLSDLGGGDPELELRKWRLALLEDLLDSIPEDAVHGLMALNEFWLQFGFPADSPHEVQGRGNAMSPADYYEDSNFRRLLSRHKTWIAREKAELRALRTRAPEATCANEVTGKGGITDTGDGSQGRN